MASLEGTTAPCIKAEINDLRIKDNDEESADEKLAKTEIRIKNSFSLFLILFESNIGNLEQKIKDLREVADGLERVHFGTTVGSLTGGVISAIGGVASVVGIAMAPFTFGTSLIVTGLGAGIAVTGGVTSGASTIVKMVNESMDRESFEKLLKDYEDLMKPITECLRELSENIENLQKLKSIREEIKEGFSKSADNIVEVGSRMGKSLAASAPEVVRLVQLANLGKVAAKASRAVRVAGMFTGVLSGLFVFLDGYFIYKDAKEIYDMKTSDTNSSKSAVVEFIAAIRKTASQLEDGLNELREVKKMLNEGGAQIVQ